MKPKYKKLLTALLLASTSSLLRGSVTAEALPPHDVPTGDAEAALKLSGQVRRLILKAGGIASSLRLYSFTGHTSHSSHTSHRSSRTSSTQTTPDKPAVTAPKRQAAKKSSKLPVVTAPKGQTMRNGILPAATMLMQQVTKTSDRRLSDRSTVEKSKLRTMEKEPDNKAVLVRLKRLTAEEKGYQLGDRVLFNGQRGNDVQQLANLLIRYGYLDGKEIHYDEGYPVYDTVFIASVKALQVDAGLPENGVAGKSIIAVLYEWEEAKEYRSYE